MNLFLHFSLSCAICSVTSYLLTCIILDSCSRHDAIGNSQGGYRGFYSKNTMQLTPKVVNDIHKRGGTFLQTSRGGHDTNKIVDNIHDRGINQVTCFFPLASVWMKVLLVFFLIYRFI